MLSGNDILPAAKGVIPSSVPMYFQNGGLFGQAPGTFAAPFANIAAGLGGMLWGQNQTSPGEAASPYLEQIAPMLHEQLDPFTKAGTEAIPVLQQQYQSLLNNPANLYKAFGGTYQQSPGYEWQRNQALGAIDRAAAAGGMLGTPAHQQQAGQVATQLANQDYYNYVNNIVNMFNRGLSGTENLFGTGANAASSLAEQLTKALVGQASNAYESQAAANKQGGLDLGSILSGVGAVAAFL